MPLKHRHREDYFGTVEKFNKDKTEKIRVKKAITRRVKLEGPEKNQLKLVVTKKGKVNLA